ncbi:PREDICTED: RNA-binding protein 7 [Nelumbo nucifera]|uniref:RNA-binding protein 7 n=1 Tax=Nelumbo nucifera TaxID=4432 RepID=A0A1U7ZI33_NELNU|nr:PREDICTED: RNA-binding protein 7 [Nelumbo nucifera]
MPGNPGCTVYIGNLDEGVSDRVLYEILIQVGRIVDLHIPRDKETNKHRGYAFVEYESEEIAQYAVRLFSGLVTLRNRTLKFAISGQNKSSQSLSTPVRPMLNSSHKPRPYHTPIGNTETLQQSSKLLPPCRFSEYPSNNAQESPPLGVAQPNAFRSDFNSHNYNYSRRVLGATFNSFRQSSQGY